MTRPSIRHDMLMTMTGALLLLVFSEPVGSQTLGGDVPAGKTIYVQLCARCHGTGGWGDGPFAQEESLPPANFHSPIVQSRTDEQLMMAIEFGFPMTKMHAWRSRLSDQEMRDVVAYIRFLTQRAR